MTAASASLALMAHAGMPCDAFRCPGGSGYLYCHDNKGCGTVLTSDCLRANQESFISVSRLPVGRFCLFHRWRRCCYGYQFNKLHVSITALEP